jgi:hypothetical protein
MTIFRCFLIIVLSCVAFAGAGLAIGYGLAVFAPSYYRSVFVHGREPGFDPMGVGIGLGLTQGAVCGVIVGCVIVLATAWYKACHSPRAAEFPPSFSQPSGFRQNDRISEAEQGRIFRG